MAQTFPDILAGDSLVNSRGYIVSRTDALRSLFSGATAPSSPVYGQPWIDSDDNVLKICTNATGPVWSDLGACMAANSMSVTKLAATATNKLFGRFTASAGAGEEIGLGTGFSFSGGNLTINVATALGYTPFSTADLDTDTTLAANSNTKVATQAATKAYVDNIAAGLRWKPSVRVATTAAGTLASSFANGQTVDGVVLATGDRILIKNQAAGAENGIYTVNASGAPTRASDMNTSAEALQATVFVQSGTTNADTQWTCTTDTITLGSTALTFAQVSGAGTYSASGGITLTGNAFSITTNGITDAMLRQGSALSVIGRSANSTGNVANIAAASDGHVLRRASSVLGFGTLISTSFADGTIVAARMSAAATQRLFGRNTAGAGNGEEVTATQALDWLSSTRGAILSRGASTWGALAQGTSGHPLVSAGANADPSFSQLGAAALGTAVITGQTEDTNPDPNADFVLTYDASGVALKKVLLKNLKVQEVITIAVGDETTAITTGTAKVTFRMPYAFTVTAVRASVNTVSSSGLPTVDINEAGVSILGTKLSIDASEKTSTTAATAATITDASLADDAEMTIDIDVAGTGAKGLKVQIIGYRT